MSTVSSRFREKINVAVIGTSGGVGQALARQFASNQNVANLYCLSRSNSEIPVSEFVNAESIFIDITTEDSISEAAKQIPDRSLDIVIVATGLLHKDSLKPEKRLADINFEKLSDIFSVNTFGPVLIAKHFLPLLIKETKSVFAALSARVGSISDNRLGGWYSYRASKSALNMLLKTAAIEISRSNKNACVIGLHPGTVDTHLSKPFQANVEQNKLFSSEFSAEKLIAVINSVDPSSSGQTFAWDGKQIPF